ncbi:MAG: aminotransferase class V-fold PLP-dependent enzyme [Chloroflexi bacterium]|nr:aminotransferase class V-fold PLP-dependent enzyme [Chloroflexota bacterium]
MDANDSLLRLLSRLPPSWTALVEKILRRLPAFQKQVAAQSAAITHGLDDALHPYRARSASYTRLPKKGLAHAEILAQMQALQEIEASRWKEGFVSGAVYHGDPQHIDFLNQVYALHSQTNPLHSDVWPSISKYEAETVAMTAALLGAPPDGEVCGAVTSGGTESILLAMKTYRDRARQERGVTRPEMVLPVTAHAAFDKAAQYFGICVRRIPVDGGFKADLNAARKAINRNTVVVVGSAPSFPHGVVDPIAELSELARQRGVGFHTDACLGGFLLPWAEKLGYPAPPFDFRLPGVTSISADTHKYGYAAKGTSVALYRTAELRRYQFYAIADWPGGLYFSPTFAGSRPGALSAACWAAMLATGEEGYRQAAQSILETAAWIRAQIQAMPDLTLLGDSLFVIAFASPTLNIYQVMERLAARGWSLNGLHRPVCLHLCVTLRHAQPGVAARFTADLQASLEEVKAHPEEKGGMAPVYGMAAAMPLRGLVKDMLKGYLDTLMKP